MQDVLQPMTRRFGYLLLAALIGLAMPSRAGAATVVPEGNRHAEQPAVPGASSRRTAANKTSFDAKYDKVLALLRSDAKLRSKIKQAAGQFGIDPVHIAGAIVGEHTYNVDVYDRLLRYVVRRGRDLGQVQIKKGWARVYVYDRPFDRLSAYHRAQTKARRADRGVWGLCGGFES